MTTDPALAAAAFLREHAREAVNLGDVADHVGYSPFHLARSFTATLRTSPIRYLAAYRFHLAKQLLLTEELNVVDVCHEVGFSSPGTFTRRFRGEVGVAPGDLRRLADEITESTPDPFHRAPHGFMQGAPLGLVTGRVEVPAAAGRDPLVWIGTYPRPEPSGLPGAGVLRRGSCEFTLPVVDGFPWLLATVAPDVTDPVVHLAADVPLVAMHLAPISGPTHVDLQFRPALEWEPRILTALPALRKIGVS